MAVRIQSEVLIQSAQRILSPGQIVVQAGRIVEVTERCDSTPDIKLDRIALMPGLINAHTHLEFSDLPAPLPPGSNFPEWIAAVLAWRQNQAHSYSKATVIAHGLRESAAAGVAVVADIVTPPWPTLSQADWTIANSAGPGELSIPWTAAQRQLLAEHLPADRNWPKVMACIEQLGLSPQRSQQALQWRDLLLSQPEPVYRDHQLAWALSPHAPYSTPESLCQATVSLAIERGWVVAMHLAESPAEREWLDHGSGPMAQLLEQFGVTTPPSPQLLLRLIESLASAPRALLIHGNYLRESELDYIANTARPPRIVYCPRTHAHFAHAEYPLRAMQARGLSIVLGTDSRSTNPDLNLWLEARAALEAHTSWRPTAAFHAITQAPALALGLASDYGTLTPGCVARLNYLPLHGTHACNNEDLLQDLLFNQVHPLRLEP